MMQLSKFKIRKSVFITHRVALDLSHNFAMQKVLVIQQQGSSTIVLYSKALPNYQAVNDICLRFENNFLLFICGAVAQQLNESVCLSRISKNVYEIIDKELVAQDELIEIYYE